MGRIKLFALALIVCAQMLVMSVPAVAHPPRHLLGKAVCVVRYHHHVRPCPHYRVGPRTASWT